MPLEHRQAKGLSRPQLARVDLPKITEEPFEDGLQNVLVVAEVFWDQEDLILRPSYLPLSASANDSMFSIQPGVEASQALRLPQLSGIG